MVLERKARLHCQARNFPGIHIYFVFIAGFSADLIQRSLTFAFNGPVGAFGQGSIQIVDAGRLLIDFSESGDGPGEVFRESRKVYVQIIAAITGLDEPQYGDALRRLAYRYWAEGEAMALARIAAPAAPHPHSTP